MTTKKNVTIVIDIVDLPATEKKTVGGLSYYMSGDGIGFSVKCSCGKDHTFTKASLRQIKKDMEGTPKVIKAPRIEIEPYSFKDLDMGELLVVTSNTNGHSYPLNYPIMKTVQKSAGGTCLIFPGSMVGGNRYDYFYQGNTIQDSVNRIVGLNKEFLDTITSKHILKFFEGIPIKKL